METNNEKDRKVIKEMSVTDAEEETPRNEENVEKSTSSKITSKFTKKHGRTNHAFGAGHEPGTIPGGNI